MDQSEFHSKIKHSVSCKVLDMVFSGVSQVVLVVKNPLANAAGEGGIYRLWEHDFLISRSDKSLFMDRHYLPGNFMML